MSYRIPVKRIITKEHLDDFLNSKAHDDYINYILRLNDSIKNTKISADIYVSKNVKGIIEALSTLSNWVSEIPPVANSKSRFGNPAFKDFYDKVKQEGKGLFQGIIPEAPMDEVFTYFVESFGNQKRIDYGTGHEANFLAWLLCLDKIGILTPEDDQAVILRIFVSYIFLMRKLQFEYWLEPAGSHGVWGLDDYHFLPFLFGSSQLFDHKYIKPKSIHNNEIVDEFSKDYMYLACIQFINSIKTTASLRWHSPMLDDISACKLWSKVNQGMIKMYKADVLAKLPIMQHFMFGSLIHFDGGDDQAASLHDDCGHVHGNGNNDNDQHNSEIYAMGQEHPECCGIPVPSAIAAANALKKDKPIARPIPFD